MIDTNTQYYNQHAEIFSESTLQVDMSPLYDAFLPLVAKGGSILDAGCGSGRDSLAFSQLGFNVTAFDASAVLVDFARDYSGVAVQHTTFQNFRTSDVYDGIWCCASLLHVPLPELTAVFEKLHHALKASGILYVSFKYGTATDTPRQHNGRLFTDMDEAGLNHILANIPTLTLHKTWITGDQRPGRENEKWLNALLLKV